MTTTATCRSKGHVFAVLNNHPEWDGKLLCPFCASILLLDAHGKANLAITDAANGWGRAAERLQELALLKSAARKLVVVIDDRSPTLVGLDVFNAARAVKERLNERA